LTVYFDQLCIQCFASIISVLDNNLMINIIQFKPISSIFLSDK
jgi:hypothetical protein